jgi:hypothetical protein
MLALWGVPERPGRASNRTSDQLCRIYLAFSLGLLQPLFCLLALLLCQSSLRHAPRPQTAAAPVHNAPRTCCACTWPGGIHNPSL